MSRFSKLAAKKQRLGATSVEFALAAPILFTVLFAIIEFGNVMMVRNALTNSAREGCRRAALATTTDRNQVNAVVTRQLSPVLLTENIQVESKLQ